ncbi:hypothetical protein JCM8547_007920 [Rhodosporidiobolus lusitaniae]
MAPQMKLALPTMALGQGSVGHRMPDKLKAARDADVAGIEVFYPCLQAFAEEFEGETEREKLRKAATETGRLAKELGLDMFVLQPLLNYDGIKDEQEHAKRIEDVKFRFELCKLLDCGMMQIPANFRLDDGVTGDEEKVVADLRELADLGLQENPPIRFAYEAMCWSTYNYTWKHSWDIVRKVDRPNFGLVLDAFHICGYEFANPTFPSGTRIGGYTRLQLSLNDLVSSIPASSIFYLQLADAELLSPPLIPLGAPSPKKEEIGKTVSRFHVDGQQPRMSWSRNCRLYPYEEDRGGYMPVQRAFKAFLETGVQDCYVSFELFHRELLERDTELPKRSAERAKRSWEKLKQEFSL